MVTILKNTTELAAYRGMERLIAMTDDNSIWTRCLAGETLSVSVVADAFGYKWKKFSSDEIVTDAFTIAADGSRAFAANTEILRIYMKSTDAATVDLGWSASGTDIFEDIDLPAATWVSIPINEFRVSAGSIHFTGINSSTDIKIVKQAI